MREIATEEDQFVKGKDGEEDKIASKAEALARIIWKYGLGFEQEVQEKIGNKIVTRKKTVPPNLSYINVILDRMEGKAGSSKDADEKTRPSASERVEKKAADRINSSITSE
jgi:hypothetical protein